MQPQYGQPQYAPLPQQQYVPSQQVVAQAQYAPQPQQQYAPPAPQASTIPVFTDPIVPAAEPGPGFGELVGRSVAIFVHSVALGPNYDKAKPDVDTARFDLYVIDGGTLAFGAAPKATPPRMMPTHTIEPACLFRGQMSSNEMIVRALKPLVGQGRFLIGVVGTLGRGYVLNAIENEAHKAYVQVEVTRLLADEQAGRPLPAAVPFTFGQPQAPAQQASAPPMPNYAPPVQPQQYAPQAPAQPHPQAAQGHITQPWQQQQQQQPATPAAPPQPAQQQPMTAELWATLSPEQQAFWQQSQGQQAQQVTQPPNPF